jgi:diguanylate cyclase (GGDEF)-like protein/PAS domain S-box-containing protein
MADGSDWRGDHFFAGGGEMGARMSAHDWAETSLGAPGTWPQSIRTAASIMLSSKFPMFLAWGPDLICLYNDGFAEILGTEHPSTLGRPLTELWPGIWPEIGPLIERALAGEATFQENRKLVLIRKGHEEETYFTFSYSPVRDETGGIGGLLCICTETTDQVLAEKRLSSVLESTTDSVMVFDHAWRITYMNLHAKELLGRGRDVTVGKNLREVFPEDTGGTFDLQCQWAIDNQAPVVFEEFHPAACAWLEVHAYPTKDTVSAFFRDVTERRRTQEQMQYLAHHDPLTGLANRSLFYQQLDEALVGIRAGSQVAVLYIDLDYFKEVNDTRGHPVGDALLIKVAERLRVCVRETDTIARLGGDEFALIQTGPHSRSDASDLARRIINTLSAPYEVSGDLIRIGASIGIAIAPGGGADANDLFKSADIALYSAKADGRGTYHFFEPAMKEPYLARQALKTDLRLALANGEFQLAYQPIIDVQSNQVRGFEALLRWQHPDRGFMLPAEFIPVAEETGLILPIGEWVLERACAEASKWPEQLWVAVNLSPSQFQHWDLPEKVAGVLSRAGLHPSRLELEITESVLLHDSKANLLTLHKLRELGIRLALDDFGTGYSSLSYLQKFPFSKIKIDRSFISELPDKEEANALAIVRAIAALGRSLGMSITAEGVETQLQLDRIRARGCDEAQGYFFSKPIWADEVEALLGRLEAARIPVS